jgi:hypothetical protein
LIGGTIRNGKLERPGEIRGEAIEGGTPYPVKAGDTLYVPKNRGAKYPGAPGVSCRRAYR